MLFELVMEEHRSWDFITFSRGLEYYVENVKEAVRTVFGESIDTFTALDSESLYSYIRGKMEELYGEQAWWQAQLLWSELQLYSLERLKEKGGIIAVRTGMWPHWGQRYVCYEETCIVYSWDDPALVVARGCQNVSLMEKNKEIDKLCVPNNRVYWSAHKRYMTGFDSRAYEERWSVMGVEYRRYWWWADGILWYKLPTLEAGDVIEDVLFPRTFHGVHPIHLDFVNKWYQGYSLELVLNTSVPASATFTFRDINDYTRVLDTKSVELEPGSSTFILRPARLFVLEPLPSIALTISVTPKVDIRYKYRVNVKLERIRSLNIFETLERRGI